MRVGVCVICLVAGASAMYGYLQYGPGLRGLYAAQWQEGGGRAELSRMRLALVQEAASRAAAQKAAEAWAAEVSRLEVALRFLHEHGASR
ncbi:hypothetical protein R75461_07882 [Paraburkholderia nemoris]|uniref:hypothetical protein n=1 Tax=Paraburkholderia nemoris TaxID=2793076 RepID=UPI001909D33D|nr:MULTISPECIES: hypothetical protein [Paraburkholderia]MBK3786914.1 hypothetical protein [Paraburkholderia aspalathi]CAE6858993.1 hypothetical protein R75461_07882 [Paraburkholderia nemoris]